MVNNLNTPELSSKSLSLLRKLFLENPRLDEIYNGASSYPEVQKLIRGWAMEVLGENPTALEYLKGKVFGMDALSQLRWQDMAAIRIIDYIENAGRKLNNPYDKVSKTIIDPFKLVWDSVKHRRSDAKPLFFRDMVALFRQLTLRMLQVVPSVKHVEEWMGRWRYGLEQDVINMREQNRERIIRVLVSRIKSCEIGDTRFCFEPDLTLEQKLEKMRVWWNDYQFHLRFAVRTPSLLNEMLDNSLDADTQRLLEKAEAKGIPFFVNPYYLSLLNVSNHELDDNSDLAIRHYVIYSKPLVEHFGEIRAWEKEDQVKPGEPNAAGWLLPSDHCVHRRYPEVAILIPETMGRACGGLCVSCQRMYDFQRGNLNFNLKKLKPKESWNEKLERLLEYWENDTQLRDILITGGDALMSQDKSLENILESVFQMAKRKREANEKRPEGKKYANIQRIRLGSRLLAYLPQRITPELTQILASFRRRAKGIGVEQFVIQSHFESPMEVTPEAKLAVERLLSAGWIVTNQLVFTTAASRRGHTAKLRKVLNDIGVIPYYTFSVKGFQENAFNYATNARLVQEGVEEKLIGAIDNMYSDAIRNIPKQPEWMVERLRSIRDTGKTPFLASDRNVINLPGVGKSLTFRTVGITPRGRRILEFDYDHTRWHSPIIHSMGKVMIVESKPVGEYLNQLEELGENVEEYSSLWGYSIGETEPRFPLFEYPKLGYSVTDRMTNLGIDE